MTTLTCARVAGRGTWGARPAAWLDARGSCTTELVNPGISALAWSRASPLGRAVLAASAEVLDQRPDLDRQTLPMVWVTGFGELRATEGFLVGLAKRGRGRPRSFRDSVHNTAASLVSLHLGLQGAVETVVPAGGGAATALMRAESLVQRHGACLLVGGDDGAPCADALAGKPLPLCVGAALVEADGDGLHLDLTFPSTPPRPVGRAVWAVDDAPPPEGCPVWLGGPASGLPGLVACIDAGGGQVVERSGRAWMVSTARAR